MAKDPEQTTQFKRTELEGKTYNKRSMIRLYIINKKTKKQIHINIVN